MRDAPINKRYDAISWSLNHRRTKEPSTNTH